MYLSHESKHLKARLMVTLLMQFHLHTNKYAQKVKSKDHQTKKAHEQISARISPSPVACFEMTTS